MSNGNSLGRLMSFVLAIGLLAGCATANEQTTPPIIEKSLAEQLQGNAVSFGDWVIGCGNLGTCTAIVAVREYSAGLEQASLRIILPRDAADAPRVAIVRSGEVIEDVSPEAAIRLIFALHDGGDADAVHVSAKSVRYDVSGKGFAAAMSALAQWRALPAQQVNSTEGITSFPALRIEKPVVHPDLTNFEARCPEGHMGSSLQAWGLIGGATLWRAACGDEGLNPVSFWLISGPQGAPPEPVKFEDQAQTARAYNSWFDDSTGYLRMVHYFGHWESYSEDCGIYRAYAFGIGGMKLVEKRYMPTCGTGIGPEDWVITYRAAVFNGPDSGP